MSGRITNHVIYAAFTIWLFLVIFAGMGVFALWTRLVKPVWVSWVLLPGTIVSEMAYIFGCLITGGEIRRAKILPDKGAKGKGGEPATEAAPHLGVISPIVASVFCILACGAGIIAADRLLESPVLDQFRTHGFLSQTLPRSADSFWDEVSNQVRLLREMCETWTSANWANWRVDLFIYLTICLSVRLAPAGRSMRTTLVAVVIVAAGIAGIGAVNSRFTHLIEDLWPLLTYVWANLLFLLTVTLILLGIVRLGAALIGGHKPVKKPGPD